VLYGLAAALVIARTARRLIAVHRLELDDAFVWFALTCLSAATGIFLKKLSIIMLQEAMAMVPDVIVPITQVSQLISSINFLDAFLCTIWTCTFAIKGSFLVLFGKLIKGISKKLDLYFRFVIGYTILTWIFLVVEPFILCPYFGSAGGNVTIVPQYRIVGKLANKSLVKCWPETIYNKTVALTVLITILDIGSDIMSTSRLS